MYSGLICTEKINVIFQKYYAYQFNGIIIIVALIKMWTKYVLIDNLGILLSIICFT